jgi:hypothetical protein
MDYGSFQWWLLDSDGVADLHGEDIAFQIVEHPYVLTLGEERFDPLVGLPNLAPNWTGAENPGPDLHLIQAVAPIRPAWLDELRSLVASCCPSTGKWKYGADVNAELRRQLAAIRAQAKR